jgi:hypothetical protein
MDGGEGLLEGHPVAEFIALGASTDRRPLVPAQLFLVPGELRNQIGERRLDGRNCRVIRLLRRHLPGG